jgi:predicted dienelactone hydrolase
MKCSLSSHLVLCAAVLTSLWSGIGATIAAEVGVTSITFTSPFRSQPINALLWYPAKSDGVAESVGKDAVFAGEPAQHDATLEAGRYPLILLSHGAGGNAANLGWISATLVKAGYIVASPNHPGSTSHDSRPETNILAWQRPQDMTALLDTLSTSGTFQAALDMSDVTAMGFSMGGYTALALGGARIAAIKFADYCDSNKEQEDCIWYDRGNDYIKGHVDLHTIDASKFEASYADSRITRIIAIDPAIAQAYVPTSLITMDMQVLFVNLGDPISLPLGIDAHVLASSMPNATYATIRDANHFTFLGECRFFGWVALMFDGDDPICTETGVRKRSEMHNEISEKILHFMGGTKLKQ